MVFTSKCSRHTAPLAGGKCGDWENKELPPAGQGPICDHLRNLEVHESMEPDEMHPQVLQELKRGLEEKQRQTFYEGL